MVVVNRLLNHTRDISYLSEALKGGYETHSEDRLSQVFTASFNHSALFRKLFYQLTDLNPLKNPCARTQLHGSNHSLAGRLDICLYNGMKQHAIIENKIDAPLYLKQLKKYNKLYPSRSIKRIAMVKHFFEPFASTGGWTILHWGEFYRLLKTKCSDKHKGADSFIVHNFISHLEALGMDTPLVLEKSELEGLAKALYKMRQPKAFWLSLKAPAFEIANQYIQMLAEIIDMTREEPVIKKVIGTSYRFNPVLSTWWNVDKLRERHLMLGVQIRIRNKRHKARSVGTAMLFYNNAPRRYQILTYWQEKDDTYFLDGVKYRGNDLVFDKYAKQVITHWKKWLK